MSTTTPQEIFVRTETVLKMGQQLNISLPDDERAFTSKLEEIADGGLVLTVPCDEDKCPIRVPQGTSLTCDFFDGTSYYRFAVDFLRRVNENIPLWHTDKPIKVQKIQHRAFVRMKTEMPMVLRLFDDAGKEKKMIFTTTVDISGGGICFRLNRHLVVGRKVSVELGEIPGIGFLNQMAIVRRCAESDEGNSNEKTEYYIGAEFAGMDSKVRDKLINYIFDLLRKACKHTLRH